MLQRKGPPTPSYQPERNKMHQVVDISRVLAFIFVTSISTKDVVNYHYKLISNKIKIRLSLIDKRKCINFFFLVKRLSYNIDATRYQ